MLQMRQHRRDLWQLTASVLIQTSATTAIGKPCPCKMGFIAVWLLVQHHKNYFCYLELGAIRCAGFEAIPWQLHDPAVGQTLIAQQQTLAEA